MTRLFFSNTANQLTLSAGVVASDTVLVFSGTATGWPASPCKAVIEPDTDLAEVVLVTVLNPSTFQVTRGQDGTTAQNHGAGAIVEHRWSAAEADEANLHANLNGGVHGITGNVVGTDDTQELTNKTVTSPLINTETVQTSSTTPGSSMKAGTNGVNIQEWQDAAGVRLSRVGPNGDFLIQPNSASVTPLVAQGVLGQTADLLAVETSTAVKRLAIGPNSAVFQPGGYPGVKIVAPDATQNDLLVLRDSTDTTSKARIDSFGNVEGAAFVADGAGANDAIQFPSGGAKFKVDSTGKVTSAAGAAFAGSVTGANLPQVRTADGGVRIMKGTFSFNTGGTNADSGTLTFPTAFSSATGVVVTGTVQVGSNFDMLLNWQNTPTASSVTWRVVQKDAVAAAITGTVHWIAMGPN